MDNLTKEQKRISATNYRKASEYFNLQKGEVLHHVDPSWKHTDIERYILWLPEDLVVMTRSEHTSLHWSLNHDERCKKLSEAKKGKPSGAKGKHWTLSEETKKRQGESKKGLLKGRNNPKVSEALKGRHWKLENGKRVWYTA